MGCVFLLSFSELVIATSTDCEKRGQQAALPECPASFDTNDTTIACGVCVNKVAHIRECGCGAKGSCGGAATTAGRYMVFHFGAAENSCNRSASEYLTESTSVFTKYQDLRQTRIDKFWEKF